MVVALLFKPSEIMRECIPWSSTFLPDVKLDGASCSPVQLVGDFGATLYLVKRPQQCYWGRIQHTDSPEIMSAPEKKPTRKGPSLVSAATQARSAAQPQASASSSSTNGNASAYRPPPPTRPGAYVPSAPATVASGSTSGRSTPTLQDGNPGTPGLWGPLGPPLASAGAAPAPRLKFRPKQPSVRPVKT